ILKNDLVRDIVDEGLERDMGPIQMPPLDETGERRRIHLVSARDQQTRHLPPDPAALATTVNENENRHAAPSPLRAISVGGKLNTNRADMRGYFAIGVEGMSKPQNAGNLMRSAH